MSDKTFTQQIEVAGHDLVEKVKELAKDADAKRVVIRDQEGKELLAFPLTWGVAGGALAMFAAPVLAAVAAVGALAADVKLEVERTGDAESFGNGQAILGSQGGSVAGHPVEDDPAPSGGDPHLPPPPPQH